MTAGKESTFLASKESRAACTEDSCRATDEVYACLSRERIRLYWHWAYTYRSPARRHAALETGGEEDRARISRTAAISGQIRTSPTAICFFLSEVSALISYRQHHGSVCTNAYCIPVYLSKLIPEYLSMSGYMRTTCGSAPVCNCMRYTRGRGFSAQASLVLSPLSLVLSVPHLF